jgi:endonuclease/exonuclease/phosphatase (EEP) superfamily protein YafD
MHIRVGGPLGLVQLGAVVAWASGGRWWVLDLANHAVVLWAWLALLGAGACVRRPRWAAAFLVVAVVHGARWIAPALGPAGAGTRPLTLVLANVYTGNPDRASLLALVAAESPDVVGLLEVDGGWIADLGPLRSSHPHHLELPREDNFGIALYSRRPLGALRRLDLGPAGVPSIEARVDGLPVLLTHPLPPVSADYAAARDAQLGEVAAWTRAQGDVFVVVGDLNTTPWGATFPGHARGLPWGTFPAGLPTLVAIPIDHVLAGPAVGPVRRRVGPDIGSDHRPVLVELAH